MFLFFGATSRRSSLHGLYCPSSRLLAIEGHSSSSSLSSVSLLVDRTSAMEAIEKRRLSVGNCRESVDGQAESVFPLFEGKPQCSCSLRRCAEGRSQKDDEWLQCPWGQSGGRPQCRSVEPLRWECEVTGSSSSSSSSASTKVMSTRRQRRYTFRVTRDDSCLGPGSGA